MDRNIGANSETDAGLYFQFGDIVGYRDATHSTFITYTSVPNSDNDLDKSLAEVWLKEYMSNNQLNYEFDETFDYTNGQLNNEVDAAFNHTNGQAKMPTYSQIYELVSYTNILCANDYKESGVHGIIFTNKKKSSKFIFIPAYGYAHHNDFYDVGYYSSCSSCQASDELQI